MVVVKSPLRPLFFTFRVNVLGPGAQHAQPNFYLLIYETMTRLRLEKLNFIFNNSTITQIRLSQTSINICGTGQFESIVSIGDL